MAFSELEIDPSSGTSPSDPVVMIPSDIEEGDLAVIVHGLNWGSGSASVPDGFTNMWTVSSGTGASNVLLRASYRWLEDADAGSYVTCPVSEPASGDYPAGAMLVVVRGASGDPYIAGSDFDEDSEATADAASVDATNLAPAVIYGFFGAAAGDACTWSTLGQGLDEQTSRSTSHHNGTFLESRNFALAVGSDTYETAATRALTGVNSRAGSGWAAVAVAIPYNRPPNAPLLLSPTGGKVIDRNAPLTLRRQFSDPDTGDSQSAFEDRYRPIGGTWTTIEGTTATTSTIPAGTLAAGDYEWDSMTADALGEWGPRSEPEFFTASDAPDVPSFAEPASGETITSETYSGSIVAADIDAWQFRVLGDDGAGNPDEANVIVPITDRSAATRRFTATDLPDGETVHIQARTVKDLLWSDWATSTNPVSFTRPATPTVVVDDDNPTGAISVQATHPTPTDPQPTVTSVDWWRRRLLYNDDGVFTGYDPDEGGEDGIPLERGNEQLPTAVFTDWQIASDATYAYAARAWGDNGVSSWSDWTLTGELAIPYGGTYS